MLTERAPEWARCGSTPWEANRPRRLPAAEAARERYWQANPRQRVGTIVLDVDDAQDDPVSRVLRGGVPVPSYVVWNEATGHSQPGFLLADPVGRGGASLLGPQRLLDAVWHGLETAFGADRAFGRDLSRGPLAPGHTLEVLSGQVYELRDLAARVPMPPRHVRVDPHAARHADSRNRALFDHLRFVGYSLAQLPEAALTTALTSAAEEYQDELRRSHPRGCLPPGEVRVVVRHVVGWCVARRDHLSAKMPGAVDRSRQHSRTRTPPAPESVQTARQQSAGAFTAERRREATRAELRAAAATLIAQGQTVNAKTLMLATGLSKNTVYAHSDAWD